MNPSHNSKQEKTKTSVLFFSVFVIAVCGIIYELIIGTISSYLMGNSVYQFSITIGLFMSSMGLGSYLSKRLQANLIDKFILIEILIGCVGGFTSLILFASYSLTDLYMPVMFTVIIFIGTLIGLEIPILTRIVREYETLRVALGNVLSFDYVGALIGSIAFPLLLLPYFGLANTAFFVGVSNMIVVFVNLITYKSQLARYNRLLVTAVLVTGLLVAGFLISNPVNAFFEDQLYQDEIIYSTQSKYQHIVLTKWKDDLRMFIDGNIQFSSQDEYRYHESLVHIAASLVPFREKILILGGGDGMAAREILKYQDVQQITLVDIDPVITKLCQTHPLIRKLNDDALTNPKVKIINTDAKKYLQKSSELFDLIFVDLPDPNNVSLAQLYSKEFYTLLRRHLAEHGLVTGQSTSPFFARKAFWCIHHTMEEAGLWTVPYHLNVPSFGDWGFNVAGKNRFNLDKIQIKVTTRFLSTDVARRLFDFGKDITEIETEVNTLIEPVLLAYYREGWERWNIK